MFQRLKDFSPTVEMTEISSLLQKTLNSYKFCSICDPRMLFEQGGQCSSEICKQVLYTCEITLYTTHINYSGRHWSLASKCNRPHCKIPYATFSKESLLRKYI